jgi:hypothetical protein
MAKAPVVAPTPFPQLVPVKAVRCDPANLGTADCEYICRCDDGSDYAIKISKPFPGVRHTEWLCYHLGERVGLASPPCQMVEMPDGTIAFGSRWETGEIKNWWNEVVSGTIALSDLNGPLSRLFALDLFINNDDRHLNNFFIRKQYKGHSLISMDYSRAWLLHRFPLPMLPLPPTVKTVLAHRVLVHLFGNFLDIGEATKVLEDLRKVNHTEIANIIRRHPKNWLTISQKSSIMKWWKSPERIQRIDGILAGLANGTYR